MVSITHHILQVAAVREKLAKSEREKLELQLKHEQDMVNMRQDNEAKKTAALNTEREIKSLKKLVLQDTLPFISKCAEIRRVFEKSAVFLNDAILIENQV